MPVIKVHIWAKQKAATEIYSIFDHEENKLRFMHMMPFIFLSISKMHLIKIKNIPVFNFKHDKRTAT